MYMIRLAGKSEIIHMKFLHSSCRRRHRNLATLSCLFKTILRHTQNYQTWTSTCIISQIAIWKSLNAIRLEVETITYVFFSTFTLHRIFFVHRHGGISIQSYNSSRLTTHTQKCRKNLEYYKSTMRHVYNSCKIQNKKILNVNLSRKPNDKFKPFVITTWHLSELLFIPMPIKTHARRRQRLFYYFYAK